MYYKRHNFSTVKIAKILSLAKHITLAIIAFHCQKKKKQLSETMSLFPCIPSRTEKIIIDLHIDVSQYLCQSRIAGHL